MKTYYGIFLALAFVVAGCEKVVDIDLNSASPRVIIEATVSSQSELNVVRITQSVNFNAENVYPPITNATVQVNDGTTNYIFTEREPGVYRNDSIRAVAGKTYALLVQAGGKSYTAQTLMPKEVSFDSVWIRKQEMFGQSNYVVNISYTDPSTDSNYYRFVQYVNDKPVPRVYLFDDRLTSGRNVRFPLNNQQSDTTLQIDPGDRVTVDMLNIDRATYQFYRVFTRQGGPGGGSAPANPPTNISGDCLGYFGAVTKQTKSVVVVE
jgi:hypothetical protein